MDKYIIELLKTNNRIIIPELGAFITKKDEPGIIVFNEFLKFNDGVFVGYIAEQENIEKEKALEKTENFVKEILLELEKGEAHVIENLGEFQKDEKGKIQFVATASRKEKKAAEKEKEEETKEKEEEKKKAEEAKKKEEEDKKKAEEKEKEAVKVAAGKKEKPKELIELDDKGEKPEEEELPEKEEEIEEEPIGPPVIEGDKEPVLIYDEKKRSKGYWWLLLLLIPVVLFLIWFFLLRDRKPVEQAVKLQTEITEETATAQEEAVAEEPAETAESQQPEAVPVEPEIVEEVTQPAVTGEKRFYVVAGCFRIEENADNYVMLLRNKGYDSEKFGMIGRLHTVSVYSNSLRSEAVRKLNEIRETLEPTAWLLYY